MPVPDYVNDVKVSPAKLYTSETWMIRKAIADAIGFKPVDMQLHINCPVPTPSNLWNVEYRDKGNDNIQVLMAWLEQNWITNYGLETSINQVSDMVATNENTADKISKLPVKKPSIKWLRQNRRKKSINVIVTREAKEISIAGIYSPDGAGDKDSRFHPMYEGLFADDNEQIYVNIDLHKYIGVWSEVAIKTWLVNQNEGTVSSLLMTYDVEKVTDAPQFVTIELPLKTLINNYISIEIEVYGSTDVDGKPAEPSENKLFTINTEDYDLVQFKAGTRQ